MDVTTIEHFPDIFFYWTSSNHISSIKSSQQNMFHVKGLVSYSALIILVVRRVWRYQMDNQNP